MDVARPTWLPRWNVVEAGAFASWQLSPRWELLRRWVLVPVGVVLVACIALLPASGRRAAGSSSAAAPAPPVSAPILSAASFLTITSDLPDPSFVGQNVTVNVMVTGAPGCTPTGSVAVSAKDTSGCTIASLSGGAGSCVLSFTASGAKPLTATYTPNTGGCSGDTDTESHSVIKRSSTTTITSASPDPSYVGRFVTVTTSTTGSGPIPTGVITITAVGTSSCVTPLVLGGGWCQLQWFSAGNKTFTAEYGGNATYNGSFDSEAHTVIRYNSIVTITSDAPDPSYVGEYFDVEFVVGSGSGSTPTGSVSVYVNGVLGCTDNALFVGWGSCGMSLASPGLQTLTAQYAGDANHNGSSDSEPHTARKRESATTITADTPDPSVIGQNVLVQVIVQSVGGGPVATGSVLITGAGTAGCVAPLSGNPGAGACTLFFTSAGVKTLIADYSGDDYHVSSENYASHIVASASTATTITSDNPDPSTIGQVVTVGFSVVALAPASGTPVGNVTVSGTGTSGCVGALSGGAGSCTLTFTAAGQQSLQANYGGASDFFASSSSSEPHTVNSPTATATRTPTSLASQTRTATATPTPTSTGAASQSATATPTATQSPSQTLTATATQTGTATPTTTQSPAGGATETVTPTPSATTSPPVWLYRLHLPLIIALFSGGEL